MEITTNRATISTLEGVSPTKVFNPVAEVPKQAVKENVDVASKSAEKKPESAEKLQEAVSQINDYVQNLQRNLQFTVDEATGKDVVTIIDSESKEVIRQLPTEEALALAQRLAENSGSGVQILSTRV